jgi:nitrous oxidase accessory protein NosD
MLAITVSNTLDVGTGSLRAAISEANITDGKDEIVFDASLFTSGTPVIDLDVSLPAIIEPVKIYSDYGYVIIRDSASVQAGLYLRPNLSQGIGEDFEISDLVFEDFEYGIRVDHTGGMANATIEGVKIVGNVFIDNERGIYLERPGYPFEIRNNQIFGILDPSTNIEAGISIVDTGTVANIYNPVIDNNIIVDNEDFGIYLLGPQIEGLTISNNRIGIDGTGSAGPNGVGILIQNADLQEASINENLVEFNGDGIVVIITDGIEFTGNTIAFNVDNGIELANEAIDHLVTGNDFVQNGNAGIAIGTGLSDDSIRNQITLNYFEANGGLPIDLGRNGVVDANDSGDLDTGPNALQNFPEIIESSIVDEDTQWRVPVQLDVRANGEYRLEFYRFDPSQSIQSYTLIRAETRQVAASSGYDLEEEFLFEKSVEILPGHHLAVLVIRDNGDTSELVKTILPLIDTAPPRIDDVLLSGSAWTGANPYSYAEMIPDGLQLAPFYAQGVDRLQIQFNEQVVQANGQTLDGSQLVLYGSNGTVLDFDDFNFGYSPSTHVGTWTFDEPLAADKYRIELSTLDVVDVAGKSLDGDWENLPGLDGMGNPTWDDFSDDPQRPFDVGNGMPGSTNNRFEIFFSLLPGDSNQDGVVTSDDAELANVADIDGDGIPGTTGDRAAALTYVDDVLPLGPNSGDINDNEAVDLPDWIAFVATFGAIDPDLRADFDDDTDVDFYDFEIFEANWTTYSAWNVSPPGSSSAPIILIEESPTVINVTISGSNSTHAPYSFDAHDGSGEQLKSVPVGAADTVSITFSEEVNVVASNLTLTGLRTGGHPTLAEFSYDVETMTATWRFDDLVARDHYLISLSDAVTDVEGDRLDGDWVNPSYVFASNAAISEFPSGDGEAGGDFNFVITLLAADSQVSNVVNIYDFYVINAGASNPNLLDALFTQGDTNGDGLVDELDLAEYAATLNLNLTWLWVLGDLNGDLEVDDSDFDLMYDNWQSGVEDPTRLDGDLDGDGDLDVDDFDVFFSLYGLELEVAG